MRRKAWLGALGSTGRLGSLLLGKSHIRIRVASLKPACTNWLRVGRGISLAEE